MFTGLIEEIGKIKTIKSIPGGKQITIAAEKIMDDLKIDDSVCCSGVCLTVTGFTKNSFTVDAVGATLTKSTFASIHEQEWINLERSVRLNDRLGGHLVQGHVNGVGSIGDIEKPGDNYMLKISVPSSLSKYIVDEGSIAIDGISLTIAKIEESIITLSIIPHTWANTNLNIKKTGDKVNIETDVIAKYVEKLFYYNNKNKDTFTDSWFDKLGYKS